MRQNASRFSANQHLTCVEEKTRALVDRIAAAELNSCRASSARRESAHRVLPVQRRGARHQGALIRPQAPGRSVRTAARSSWQRLWQRALALQLRDHREARALGAAEGGGVARGWEMGGRASRGRQALNLPRLYDAKDLGCR